MEGKEERKEKGQGKGRGREERVGEEMGGKRNISDQL